MIGQRIRELRQQRGMSLATLAALSGLTKGYLSMVERGIRNLDHRRSLHAVADALKVPPNQLTGQPYDPATKQEITVRVAVTDIRDVLYGSSLGDLTEEPGRDLDQLAAAAARVADLHATCALDAAGPLIPTLLADLYAHTADPRGDVRQRALRLLVDSLHSAWDVAHWAGDADLAYRAAELAVETAGLVEDDPGLLGSAHFGLIHALGWVNGARARTRAAALAVRSADDLEPAAAAGGPAAEMYGMLRLVAAWSLLLAGSGGDTDAHFAEAEATARRTGDGSAYRLWFGPNNVAAWRIGIAVERGEGGRVTELAGAVNTAALPARERQAGHLINVGRGLAQEPRTAAQAVEVFRRARRLTPMRVRLNPYVREVTERLAWEVGGQEVRQFASWLGVIPR